MKAPPDKPEKVRVPLVLTPEEAQELDDWQFAHRHRTRTAALKAMMRMAYETAPAKPISAGKRKS